MNTRMHIINKYDEQCPIELFIIILKEFVGETILFRCISWVRYFVCFISPIPGIAPSRSPWGTPPVGAARSGYQTPLNSAVRECTVYPR